MKELDLLLDAYLNNRFIQAPAPEQQAFAALLELPDPILMAYVVGRAIPDSEGQRRVIESLRRTSRN